MIPLFSRLADHLWQSTAFAAAAGLLTLALQKNRARVRHGLWLAASCKFLAPFPMLVALGSHIHWHAASSPLTVVITQVSQPFSAQVTYLPASPAIPPDAGALPDVLVAVWACGFLGIGISWWVRWRRIAAAARAASPVNMDLPIPVAVTPMLVEPGIFGIVRPVLLLPKGILERLTPAQLETVVTHELFHVRYRDNLAAAIHMFVETLFWFHPLVWWIGKRMVEERERACDEGVVSAGSEPRTYAEAILTVCKLYAESQLACVSGVTGGNLNQRIEAIMTKRIAGDLHIAKKAVLVIAGIAALLAPLFIGMAHSPAAQAQAPAAVAVPTRAVPDEKPATSQTAAVPRTVASEDPRQARTAYAKAHFQNRWMVRTYVEYGPPDQIEDRTPETQIWRYNYLGDFRDHAEFEFPGQTFVAGMRINWPPPLAIFTGGNAVDPAAFTPLAQAFARESQELPNTVPPAPGLPGRHASIQVYSSKQPVTLMIPADTMAGRVDFIGSIVQILDGGVKGAVAANVRDYVNVSAGSPFMWQAAFTLEPGSYLCRVLVREQATGLMYTESIPFDLK